MTKFRIFAYAACLVCLSSVAAGQVNAQTVYSSTTQISSPGPDPLGPAPPMFRGPQVLDSWMEPSVVRKREVTSASGDKETLVEPLIMERHERVMIPYTEESMTERRTRGPAMISHQSYSSSSTSMHHARRHYIAHRHHVVAHAVSRKRYIAKNVTTVSSPSQLEIQRRVVEKSVVVDRKDPALNIY